MVLIILLVVNLLYFINNNEDKIDTNFLKFFTIIFTIIVSLKAFYLIYFVILIPLIVHIYKKTKSIKLIFNMNLLYCLSLFGLVILTNFFNTGCLLFPEKKTCFFNVSWSLPLETVEYLSIHYENWAKAGSGAGYSLSNSEKLNYVSNLNWFDNWLDRYFFNKVSDLIYALLFTSLVFILIFKGSRATRFFKRKYKSLSALLLVIFLTWFLLHPSLRYGGYHLFFFLFFIPISIFLEKFNKDVSNLNNKIMLIVVITALVFLGRNSSRLIKEYKFNSYNPYISFNYPLRDESFRYQKKMQKKIKDNKTKKIYRNRYIFFKN
jgi:hypothetical protein